MALETDDSSFIQISLSVLKRFKHPPMFDIYVKRTEGKYSKLFKANDNIDWDRIVRYKDKGIEFFYVLAQDYESYSLYVEDLGNELAKNIDQFRPEEVIDFLKEMVNANMHEIMIKHQVSEKAVKNAANFVSGCVQELGKDPKAIVRLIALMAQQRYIIRHSVLVSIFSMLLAHASNMTSKSSLMILGQGALLHDLGKSQLGFDPDDREILSPDERKEMWRHPELGKQLLDAVKGIRSEIVQIVMQHHEQPNGHGYPNALREFDIYPLAKIVSIADTFASMIVKRSFREAYSAHEALANMKNNPGKFDPLLLDTFTGIFLRQNKSIS